MLLVPVKNWLVHGRVQTLVQTLVHALEQTRVHETDTCTYADTGLYTGAFALTLTLMQTLVLTLLHALVQIPVHMCVSSLCTLMVCGADTSAHVCKYCMCTDGVWCRRGGAPGGGAWCGPERRGAPQRGRGQGSGLPAPHLLCAGAPDELHQLRQSDQQPV